MIRRYVYGSPFETDAILNKPEKETGPLPYFTVNEQEMAFTCKLGEADRVYGLGENVRGINKRGWIYESNCTDTIMHSEDCRALYSAHNFLVVDGKERFGLFLDHPGFLTFDIGYTRHGTLTITAADWNLDCYIITGEDVKDIVKQFRRMIGRSYIPPLWAFGFGQSRWGYKNEDDIRTVVRRHRELGIPLDSVYMDIDYMDHCKDFTLNEEAFPDFPAFNAEMAVQNIHLVPIIDAGVKREAGYRVCDEGLEKGYFCTREDGSPFLGAVWPGLALFPDMLNKEARDWFGGQYKFLLDQGVEGFWNDMNEPSIFYTEDGLKAVFEKVGSCESTNLDVETYRGLMGTVMSLNHGPTIYKTFYHNVNGQKVRHDRVHNLYGYNMSRAAGEAFERLAPDKRILMFSRSSYIGMHRYSGIWQGDNKSWWSHLLMNLKMMPSLNMCGFLYTGADIGGFNADTTEDLLLRWLALGIFTPLMRNHSALGSREQEAYRFEDMEGFRHIIGLRYRLLPYIYSEYMKAALRYEMMFRPLVFDYPEDTRAATVEDQMLVGDGIMIAPVYEQNAAGRYVYLPESMKLVRFKKGGVIEEEILPAGHHYVDVGLTDVILFVRPGHLIPLSSGGQCVKDVDFDALQYLTYVKDGEAVYEYYRDDGNEKDYDDPAHISLLRSEEWSAALCFSGKCTILSASLREVITMRFEMPQYHHPDFTEEPFLSAPDARYETVEQDGVAPDNFHSTSMYPEYFKLDGQWRLAEESRMDSCVVVRDDGYLAVVEPRNLKKGDRVIVGRTEKGEDGIYLHGSGFRYEQAALEDQFVFRQGRSRETSFARDYDKLFELLRHEREHGKIVWVMGPALAFDADARAAMQGLIDNGYAHALLAGNALATHDLEGALLHTALGQDIYSQRSQPNGHYNHLDICNMVRRSGSIARFIEDHELDDGIICSCVKNRVPIVLAGSIRDDGPLPEVIGNAYEAAQAMREQLRGATTVICLATMLHTIAAGNMTPSYRVMADGSIRPVFLYTVDADEFVVNKLLDRGSLCATTVVTNAQDFITLVAKGLGVIK